MARTDGLRDVTSRLRRDIVDGAFRPGEWLRQIDLEERYGVGRFEIRQALSQLAAARVVEHVPNRGYRVVETTVKERIELTQVRLFLECPAGRLAIEHAGPADVARIEAAARAFDDAVEVQPHVELQRLNSAFHRAFYDCCGNGNLALAIHELRERNLPGGWNQWATSARTRRSSLDHLEMVEALKARDAERLTALIERHLTRWQKDRSAQGLD